MGAIRSCDMDKNYKLKKNIPDPSLTFTSKNIIPSNKEVSKKDIAKHLKKCGYVSIDKAKSKEDKTVNTKAENETVVEVKEEPKKKSKSKDKE